MENHRYRYQRYKSQGSLHSPFKVQTSFVWCMSRRICKIPLNMYRDQKGTLYDFRLPSFVFRLPPVSSHTSDFQLESSHLWAAKCIVPYAQKLHFGAHSRTTRININRININPDDYYNPVIDYYNPLLRFEPCLNQLGLILILCRININQININPNIRSSNRLL